MKRFAIGMAALGVIILGSSVAQAGYGCYGGHCGGYGGYGGIGGYGGYGGIGGYGGFGGYQYQVPSFGYGHGYDRWSHYCYIPQHRCYGYYCAQRRDWFYYYAPRRCFLPMRYMNQFQPVVQNVINLQNTNTNVNGSGNVVPQLPSGAVPINGGSNVVMPRLP